MADNRAFFKLDVGYLTNPKVQAILDDSPLAVVLHVASIAYAAQHLTDGVVPVKVLKRTTGAEESDVAALVGVGLWHDLGDGRVEVHDYLEHNRSSAEARAMADRAAKAAAARWGKTPPAERGATASPSAPPAPKAKAATKARAQQLPDTWEPNAAHAERARADGLDLARQVVMFRAYAEEKGRTAVSWNAAFTRWLTNASEYAARDGRGNRPGAPAPVSSGWGRGVPADPYGLNGDAA